MALCPCDNCAKFLDQFWESRVHNTDTSSLSGFRPQPQAGTPKARPVRSRLYPWYDSIWLDEYTRAKSIIRKVKPQALAAFEDTMQVFRTRPDFRVRTFERVFNDETLEKIRQVVRTLQPMDFEFHEAQQFKRFIVHDHPYFTELQQQLIPLVSEAAGEPLESNYNFLSLYSAAGVCPVHMDSPEAKWTLDVCLNQSEPWPIYLSQIQAWPELDPDSKSSDGLAGDWEQSIKHSPSANFEAHSMEPGQAILFSGSSQWHYRDAMPALSAKSSCDLLFLHFIPRGTRELVRSANWARLFGIPELAAELGDLSL